MNGAARKLADGRSAASKLPSGPEREKALTAAAGKLADIFLQHDLDSSLNLEEIQNNTRRIERWADQ
jgi:hypothetical protein